MRLHRAPRVTPPTERRFRFHPSPTRQRWLRYPDRRLRRTFREEIGVLLPSKSSSVQLPLVRRGRSGTPRSNGPTADRPVHSNLVRRSVGYSNVVYPPISTRVWTNGAFESCTRFRNSRRIIWTNCNLHRHSQIDCPLPNRPTQRAGVITNDLYDIDIEELGLEITVITEVMAEYDTQYHKRVSKKLTAIEGVNQVYSRWATPI